MFSTSLQDVCKSLKKYIFKLLFIIQLKRNIMEIIMKNEEKTKPYPHRQVAIRTRCMHRLNPEELMIRRGF